MTAEQHNTHTDGGDYAGNNIDKRIGNHASNINGTIHQYYYAARTSWQQPYTPPPEPRGYVDRNGAEKELYDRLSISSANPIVLLHGYSGMGKTALVARVLKQLKPAYTGGILYQSLDNLTPNEVLGSFLQQFDSDWQYRRQEDQVQENQFLRDYFWSRLSAVKQPILLVFDQLRNELQLQSILPQTAAQLSQCHILLISVLEFAFELAGGFATDSLALRGLEPDEALKLFRQILGKTKADQYRDQLCAASERLGGNPLLITNIAHRLKNETISPGRYLSLVGNTDQQILIDEKIAQVERAIDDLGDSAQALIPLLGVLGAGDWTPDLLAAVALRSTITVRADLEELIEQGLIRVVRRDHYQTNDIVQLVAQRQFEQCDVYRQRTAGILLARYCLDLAQDIDVELRATPPFRHASGQQSWHVDAAYISEFRNRFVAEISHVRRSIVWATEHEHWDLLRRFAFTPYLELVDHFTANTGEIQMSLCMCSLVAPTVWPTGSTEIPGRRAIITTDDWVWRKTDPTQYAAGHAPAECELSWEITSGAIIDGVFRSTRLTHSRWVGVRAQDVIFISVDVVGGRFLACDFINSVWLHCDARHVMLRGTNFTGALLREVWLHAADLQHANFSGAILEYVTLRNADLRHACFDGALLQNVDLRGANLRGASFSRARIDTVALADCQLEDTEWSEADLQRVQYPDERQKQMIQVFAGEAKPVYSCTRLNQGEDIPTKNDLVGRDLRAVELDGRTFDNVDIQGANLRGASLNRAELQHADMSYADLRGADLREAKLNQATLRRANLHAADLTSARLTDQAILDGASLHVARLDQADLRGASLIGADLQSASLVRADLSGADLTDANLTSADLRGAKLIGAKMDRVLLHNANLSGADLSDARLNDSTAMGADFTGAMVTEEQLIHAERLGGAKFGNETVAIFNKVDGSFEALSSLFLYSEWLGIFSKLQITNRRMLAAKLIGIFSKTTFVDVDLGHAQLRGHFSKCHFSGANFAHAHLSGEFSKTTFDGCDFYGVSLLGAIFDNCDLSGAINLDNAQIYLARRWTNNRLPSYITDER